MNLCYWGSRDIIPLLGERVNRLPVLPFPFYQLVFEPEPFDPCHCLVSPSDTEFMTEHVSKQTITPFVATVVLHVVDTVCY